MSRALLLTSIIAVAMSAPEVGRTDMVRVVDGDTLCVHQTCYRLVGFDTPETGSRAKCQAERDLGERAKLRLQMIVAEGGYSLAPVYCACRPGTEGTQACNHGRYCAELRAGGADVGAILIREGLAREYICRGTRCPPRQGWCS